MNPYLQFDSNVTIVVFTATREERPKYGSTPLTDDDGFKGVEPCYLRIQDATQRRADCDNVLDLLVQTQQTGDNVLHLQVSRRELSEALQTPWSSSALPTRCTVTAKLIQ